MPVQLLNSDVKQRQIVGEDEEKQRSRSRKIIKKVLKRKNADGEWVPTEITKTVIEKDGSRKVSV